MKADEFHEWASSLPGDGNLRALARLSELRNQNNAGLYRELYQEMMRQNRDQVRREFEELKEEEPEAVVPGGRSMSEHGDTSVCLKCKQPIEYIKEEASNGDVLNAWWAHLTHPEDNHDAIPPLMLDDKRILAYDEEHEVFILKLDLDKLQTVRSGLVELFTRQHSTTDWRGAGSLFHQLTSEMREMDRLPGVPKNQPNISYDLTDRKLIKLSCTECGEFVRELIPKGQSRAITNDRIWHLAGEHTREKHSRDDSLNWTGKLEEKK